MSSLVTFASPRLPMLLAETKDAPLQTWQRLVTEEVNKLPLFSTFSFPTPNSNVTAATPTLGFNYAPASAASTIWLKQVGSGNTGWVALV